MRKLTFTSLILWSGLLAVQAQTPLSGVKNIPGDYATIRDAVSELNINGVGVPGVIFNIASDYKEVFTSANAGHILTTTGSANSPITFQKIGSGADPLITAALGTGSMDAIFMVAGSDYVTFDGIKIRNNPDSFGFDEDMEWGFAILKASGTDGSQHVTIRNCSVSLNVGNEDTKGIYSANHTPASLSNLTVTSSVGTNSSLKLYSNTILECYHGMYLQGSSDAAYYDQNNEIGKDGANTVTTFGGGSSVSAGIYASAQNNLKVANTTVTSAMGGAAAAYGIYLTAASNASYDLYGNTVSIQFNAPTGSLNHLFPIYCDMGGNGSGNTVNVYNNTVTNCTYPNIGSAYFYGIYLYNLGTTANVYGNTVSNNTIGSSAAIASQRVYYLYIQKISAESGPLTVHSNLVTGNAKYHAAAEYGLTKMLGITGSGTTLEVYNNTISNNIVTSNGSTDCLYLYFDDENGRHVHHNTVSNITEANGSVSGLFNSNGTSGFLYNNKIEGIHASIYATGAFLTGITHGDGFNTYYYNNVVSDLTNPGAIATQGYDYTMTVGINVQSTLPGEGGFKGFYNNTIYLNATTLSSEYGSAAFMGYYLSDIELKNNIFVNTSASAGSNGKSVVIRSRIPGFTGFTSNYNDLYAGTPGPTKLIFTDGVSSYQTLGQYQALVSPHEGQSVSAMPPFENATSAPYDTHIKSSVPTPCESGGVSILMPNVQTDFDGQPRYPDSGAPANPLFAPTAPDMGADEFGGLPNDQAPPSIIYTPLTDINNGMARTLSAVISDASGVPVSGFGLPVLYWQKNSLGYIAVQGVYTGSNTFNFTFGGGAALNDVISYYIVAQDNVSPSPNVGVSPSQGASGLSANPPVCTTPPATPSSYRIIADISGEKHVGVGKDYITLTAAANDLNQKYMAGPVTFILDDETYPGEVFPIRFNDRPGNNSTNTLTIKPNTGANPVLSGSVAGNGILVMNGIDHVTIDGSNNGTTSKNLTLENTSNQQNSHVIGITNHDGTNPSTHITIRNCTLKAQKSYAWGSQGNDLATYLVLFNFNGGLYGGGYDDCLITGNTMLRARCAINILASASNRNRNITISGNTIGSPDTNLCIQRYGIAVNYSDNTLISGNDIMGHSFGTPLSNMFGIIYYSGCSNTKIHRNKIHDWNSTGLGCYGIKCSNDNNSTPTEIFNNQIYNISTPGMNPGPANNNAYGIFIRTGSNIRIWHNTIYLHGPHLNGSDSYAPSSACICVYTGSTTALDIRDNILRNSMTNPANPAPGSGAMGRAYGIQTSSPNTAFVNLDFNDYFINGYHGTIAQKWLSGGGPEQEFETLAQWQSYTAQDAHSLTVNPGFISDTLVMNLLPTNVSLNSTGGQLILSTDFNGATRFAPPDMGAFEWSNVITNYHTLAATDITETTATLNGDINTNGEVVAGYFDYGLTTSYGSQVALVPATIRTNGTLQQVSANITGLQPNTTYHFRFWGAPTTSGQANFYGDDMTFTTNASSVPANITLNTTVSNTQCFNATQTITVAGTPNSFVVTSTGHVDLIAGVNILFMPGTLVQAGGYLHGKISGQYCNSSDEPMVGVVMATGENSTAMAQPLFSLYPNPTTGAFTLDLKTGNEVSDATVEIFDMQGSQILKKLLTGKGKHELSLSGSPAGIYLIRVLTKQRTETLRMVRL